MIHAKKIMGIRGFFFLLVGVAFTIAGIIIFIMIIKEIKEIKIGDRDGSIKAVVVDWSIINTGDICPILSYVVNNEEKRYAFHFYHRSKEYPIGKEVYLKLSEKSGLAYDKKDLIQGILMRLFILVFSLTGLLVGIYYYFIIK